MLIARRMQLKITVILKILKIRLDAIWDACINSRIFRQVVANKRDWFLNNLAPALESEDEKNH